jgi:hypothetical protein
MPTTIAINAPPLLRLAFSAEDPERESERERHLAAAAEGR